MHKKFAERNLKNNATHRQHGGPAAALLKKAATGLLAAVFWLCVWQLASVCVKNNLLLPSPASVFKAMTGIIAEEAFCAILFNSILNILKGFLWGHIAGALLAVFASASKAFKAILTPFMSVVKSTPIASFIILVYVWIDKNNTPAFISFLIVLPVVWQNIKSGILSADEKLLEAAKIYRFNFFKKVRYIYIPSVLPYYVGAFKVSMGMAWKAGVAAEVLCAAKLTLGGAIYDSKIYLETEELFAWTIVVIIISMIIEFFTVKLLDNAAKRLSIAGRDGGI